MPLPHPRGDDAEEPPELVPVDAECPVELLFGIRANGLAVVYVAAHKAPPFRQGRRWADPRPAEPDETMCSMHAVGWLPSLLFFRFML